MARALTPHFTLDEFTVSQTASRLGIDNTPGPDIVKNLKRLAQTMETVRDALGGLPVSVSSGYRCPELNKAIKGAKNSAHMSGLACDFTVPQFGTVLQVARAIAAAGIEYDQLIYEYGAWVHLGLAADGEAPRGQKLSYFKGLASPVVGLVSKP
jgi:zinc D-Ala-D-Ala carboxypeptidase